jgi:hypothetical protein
MGGLLVAVFFYKLKFNSEGSPVQNNKEVTQKLGSGLGFMNSPYAILCKLGA